MNKILELREKRALAMESSRKLKYSMWIEDFASLTALNKSSNLAFIVALFLVNFFIDTSCALSFANFKFTHLLIPFAFCQIEPKFFKLIMPWICEYEILLYICAVYWVILLSVLSKKLNYV